MPICQRTIEVDLSRGLQAENLAQLRVIVIGQSIGVAIGGSAHIATLAAEPGPAALCRANDRVINPERIEHAGIEAKLAQRAVRSNVKRGRPKIAETVENGDHDGSVSAGKW